MCLLLLRRRECEWGGPTLPVARRALSSTRGFGTHPLGCIYKSCPAANGESERPSKSQKRLMTFGRTTDPMILAIRRQKSGDAVAACSDASSEFRSHKHPITKEPLRCEAAI